MTLSLFFKKGIENNKNKKIENSKKIFVNMHLLEVERVQKKWSEITWSDGNWVHLTRYRDWLTFLLFDYFLCCSFGFPAVFRSRFDSLLSLPSVRYRRDVLLHTLRLQTIHCPSSRREGWKTTWADSQVSESPCIHICTFMLENLYTILHI